MTSKVSFVGELRTNCVHIASGSIINTDAPIDNHGKGELFSPTDLVSTMLASCMMTIMGIAAQTHGFSIDGTTAEVEKIMATNPRRIAKIRIVLDFPPCKYSDREKAFIKQAAKECPVAQSLHPDLVQDIIFNFK
ncbi:MAG: osmotically inducible protein OsmC [Bacteroidetes bacterium HGW-Bacteroidetes-6]|jgi:uncharacterized OsmC-like protein|nr:MAG: osmotically inducible protein OsmC [Bacteroidetes bacterium HGW-Bacteroidetes-6]